MCYRGKRRKGREQGQGSYIGMAGDSLFEERTFKQRPERRCEWQAKQKIGPNKGKSQTVKGWGRMWCGVLQKSREASGLATMVIGGLLCIPLPTICVSQEPVPWSGWRVASRRGGGDDCPDTEQWPDLTHTFTVNIWLHWRTDWSLGSLVCSCYCNAIFLGGTFFWSQLWTWNSAQLLIST